MHCSITDPPGVRRLLLGVLLAGAQCVVTEAQERPVQITVDSDRQLGQLYNFWSVFPVTDQRPFQDPQQFTRLRGLYPVAETVNCVRFLGGMDQSKDDYFRGVAADGTAQCDFAEALKILEGIRRCGYTPWIVLDNVPAAMSIRPTRNKYGNTEPPQDFELWSSYVRQLVQALVDRFGQNEVGRWRFRVGTEPDLSPGHWSGTKEAYLAHYDYTVSAVTSVLPDADIGPGNILDPVKHADRGWGLEIVDHCARGRNFVTGNIGTPMKFFACSYYTSVGVPDERFDEVIEKMRQKLAQYPRFVDVPVEVHEFGILTENGKLIAGDGTEFGGSWAAHMARKIYDRRVGRVYQWHWNTTKGGGLSIPVTHVLRMLQGAAGQQRLGVRCSQQSEEDDIGCIASSDGQGVDLLLFRHHARRTVEGDRKVQVVLKGGLFAGENWKAIGGSVIDRDHSVFAHKQRADADRLRQELGEDASALVVAIKVMAEHCAEYEQLSKLCALEPLPQIERHGTGGYRFEASLSSHSVIHLRLATVE